MESNSIEVPFNGPNPARVELRYFDFTGSVRGESLIEKDMSP